jgi:hypothetical protein
MTNLREWTRQFITMRAAARGQTVNIHEQPDGFSVVQDGVMTKYVVQDTLSVPKEFEGTIVTKSNKENVERCIFAWDAISSNPSLTIFFVNAENGEKWALKPYHHDKIADKSTLKQGLMTLHAHCTGTAVEERPNRKERNEDAEEESDEDEE